jgi:hypothetical protein
MHALTRTFALLLGLLLGQAAHATAQIPDTIRIDGKDYALNTNPLSQNPKMAAWKPPADASMSTANWRGYLAAWEIRDDQLLLTDVTIDIYNEATEKHGQRDVAADFVPAVPATADWYTGALIIPDGEMVDYVHMGYGSTYAHYRIYRIRQGRVLESLSLNQAEFEAYRDRKFAEFQQTGEYRATLAEAMADMGGMSREQVVDFLKQFYSEQYLAR